jgi:hypothetical protein
MFSSPLSPRTVSEVPSADPAKVAPIPLWRVAVLRSIAATHVLAGTMELLKVAGNFLLKLPYTGGPLALPGVVTVVLARFLNSLTLMSPSDAPAFQMRSQWIVNQAGSTGSFLVAMMAAHIALGAFNAALGYGLWRRSPWARWLDVAVLGLVGVLAIAHGAALLWVGRIWREFAIAAFVLSVVVALPILAFLISPQTGVLFVNRDEAPAAPRKRRWWMLSVQWIVAFLVLALASALVVLFGLGPMVEVVWIAAGIAEGRP